MAVEPLSAYRVSRAFARWMDSHCSFALLVSFCRVLPVPACCPPRSDRDDNVELDSFFVSLSLSLFSLSSSTLSSPSSTLSSSPSPSSVLLSTSIYAQSFSSFRPLLLTFSTHHALCSTTSLPLLAAAQTLFRLALQSASHRIASQRLSVSLSPRLSHFAANLVYTCTGCLCSLTHPTPSKAFAFLLSSLSQSLSQSFCNGRACSALFSSTSSQHPVRTSALHRQSWRAWTCFSTTTQHRTAGSVYFIIPLPGLLSPLAPLSL